MKQLKINLNMIISLVLAILAVVSVIGYTNSYFTASAQRDGTLNFATMNVRFAYYYKDGDTTKYYPQNQQEKPAKTQINLFPAGKAAIQRGVAFNVSPTKEGKAVENLAIHNMDTSCNAFVRFWIDAYVIKDGEQLDRNYGEFFTLNTTSDVKLTDSGSARTQSVYCLKEALTVGEYRYIGATLTMSTSAPDNLMGETLRIDICMDSVQADNDVYVSVYNNDDKGYYSGWES